MNTTDNACNDHCMEEAGTVTLTILADNTASAPYKSEHGFSAFVEERGADYAHFVLFDTGMGVLFENAPVAGIDFSQVGDVVLSHGHYDHTDALSLFLQNHPSVRIHASSAVFREHYSLRTGSCRKIGLSDGNRILLSALPEGQFCAFEKETSIANGRIHLAGRIPRVNPLETPSPLLFDDSACSVPDYVPDEIVLWTKTAAGIVILTGCCHAGFINTCEYVRAVSGIDTIHAVIGGFHLAKVSEERLRATVEYIRMRKVARVIPCHCTGDTEIEWLKEKLGTTITRGECGGKFTF